MGREEQVPWGEVIKLHSGGGSDSVGEDHVELCSQSS